MCTFACNQWAISEQSVDGSSNTQSVSGQVAHNPGTYSLPSIPCLSVLLTIPSGLKLSLSHKLSLSLSSAYFSLLTVRHNLWTRSALETYSVD